MKIIFFGTPLFAAKILEYLIKNRIEISAIITKPDKPRGRSGKPAFSAVKDYCLKNHLKIPIHQPEKASSPLFAEKLKNYTADLFVVVAYGEIVKKNLLDMPPFGCINLHASLLPKYRGASPIHAALLNGDQETGVTVIKMVEKMDAGDIFGQKRLSIPIAMHFEELEAKLCFLAQELLLEIITQIQLGLAKTVEQKESEATYVKKIDSNLAQILWEEPADVLHNRIRAFSSKPGAWCLVKIKGGEKRLKIFSSTFQKKSIPSCGEPAGQILAYENDQWIVACGEGTLTLLEVQLEGKKRLGASDFIRGNSIPPTFL